MSRYPTTISFKSPWLRRGEDFDDPRAVYGLNTRRGRSERFCGRCGGLWQKSEEDPQRCFTCFAPRAQSVLYEADVIDVALTQHGHRPPADYLLSSSRWFSDRNATAPEYRAEFAHHPILNILNDNETDSDP